MTALERKAETKVAKCLTILLGRVLGVPLEWLLSIRRSFFEKIKLWLLSSRPRNESNVAKLTTEQVRLSIEYRAHLCYMLSTKWSEKS